MITAGKKLNTKEKPAQLTKEQAVQEEPDTKLLICGLTQCRNLGDVVIADCVKYLIKKSAKKDGLNNVKISALDIRRQKDKKSLAKVRNSDLVIFPGGGFIKYKTEKFPTEMGRFTDLAEHYGIPVMYNAMGVEGFDAENEGCMTLKAMLEARSSRYITSRDYSDFLNETYLKDSHLTSKKVADPAVWTSEAYKIKRKSESDIVGLGVARGKLFESHGVPVSKEDLLVIWSSLVKALEAEGIKYRLFTNGLKLDEDFLTELLEYMGKENQREEITLPAAENAKQLVEYISGFSSVVACRMHANIIAFSLGIPSVAFVWNDKLRAFGESIGCAERYLEYTQLKDTELIVNTFKKAQAEGYADGVLKREKNSAYKSIREFLSPFEKELITHRRRDLSKVTHVFYGLPNPKSYKLNDEFFEKHVKYFVTDDKELVGAKCFGKPVYSSRKLRKLIKPFVIVSETMEYPDCARVLEKYGYKEKRDFTNMHGYTRYLYKKGEVFLKEPKETCGFEIVR